MVVAISERMVKPSKPSVTLKEMEKPGCHPNAGCVERTRRMEKMRLMMKRITIPTERNICAASARDTLSGLDTDAIRRKDVKIRDIQNTKRGEKKVSLVAGRR